MIFAVDILRLSFVFAKLVTRAEANGGAGGAERPPSRPFVGKFCSLVGIFVF